MSGIYCQDDCVLRPGHTGDHQDRETAVRVLSEDIKTILGLFGPLDDAAAFDLARVALQDNIRQREAEARAGK